MRKLVLNIGKELADFTKHVHDRWIGPYASGAIALLDRLNNDLEDNRKHMGARTG
jgi:hypothetical protein